MDKEYFNVLIFGHKTSKMRHLKIHKKTVKVALYLLGLRSPFDHVLLL